jgi:hypothetical protein
MGGGGWHHLDAGPFVMMLIMLLVLDKITMLTNVGLQVLDLQVFNLLSSDSESEEEDYNASEFDDCGGF